MVLDVRMQLDINVQMRQIPRPRPIQRPQAEAIPVNAQNVSFDDSISESSWTTLEEQEITDVDTE